MTSQFRLCAAAVVFNSKGKVLLGNRSDRFEDAWQFPQGGIEKGETPLIAAKRELFEETNVVSVKDIYCDDTPYRYNFPESVKDNFRCRGIYTSGQDIYFSLFYFFGNESEINVHTACPEFKEYGWKDFDFAVKNIISFKKDVYLSAAVKLKPLIAQYLNSIS
ncbi:MAG: NUDIX domain-containing protein [Acetobacter sp.]|nr:NUDIX domain-containing protein [Acetobacter sp.]